MDTTVNKFGAKKSGNQHRDFQKPRTSGSQDRVGLQKTGKKFSHIEQKVSDSESDSEGEPSPRGDTAREPLHRQASDNSNIKQSSLKSSLKTTTKAPKIQIEPGQMQKQTVDPDNQLSDRPGVPSKTGGGDDFEAFKFSMHQALVKRMQAPDFAQAPTTPRPPDTHYGNTEASTHNINLLHQGIQNHLRKEFLAAMSKPDSHGESKTNAKNRKEEKIDISKCQGSDHYFDLVSHQIPVSELYTLEEVRSNSEQNRFCAILLKIVSLELRKQYEGCYLLQVWTRDGNLVYNKILQNHLCLWQINGKYLIMVQDETEQPEETKLRGHQQIFVVKLETDKQKMCHQTLICTSTVFKFYVQEQEQKNSKQKIELDKYLGFIPYEKVPDEDDPTGPLKRPEGKKIGGHLIVANDRLIKYVEITDNKFMRSNGEKGTTCLTLLENDWDALTVKFKYQIRLLTIIEIQDGRPCLVTESATTGQISFLKLWIEPTSQDGEKGTLVFDELNDKSCTVVTTDQKLIPVKKLISTIFKCELSGEYRQCGLALRTNGSLDYLWNFRIVDTMEVKDYLVDGFVDDITSDFGHLYFKKISFGCEPDVLEDLRNPNSSQYKALKEAFSENHITNSFEQEVEEVGEAEHGGSKKKNNKQILSQQKALEIIKLEETLYCCQNQWKERIGVNTSEEICKGSSLIQKKYKDIMNQKVANFARIYPWFSNMNSHFLVAHAHFLSLFNITSQQWEHRPFGDRDEIIGGFRIKDKESEDFWAGIVLRSQCIKFIRAIDGLRGEEEGASAFQKEGPKHPRDQQQMQHRKQLPLGGECIKIAIDKWKQRFTLFLIKENKIKKKYVDHSNQLCNKHIHLNKIEDESKQEYKLSLKMFVDGNTHQLWPFDDSVMEDALKEESEIFVVPSVSGPDDALIVIDNTTGTAADIYYFKIRQIKSKPELSSTGFNDDETIFARPYNKSLTLTHGEQGAEDLNKMVGFIQNNSADGSQAIVFVTRNDVILAKLGRDSSSKESKLHSTEAQIRYKYFNERNIQAILQLGTWMYSLSNACANSQNQNKTREYQIGYTKKELIRRKASHYFSNQGLSAIEGKGSDDQDDSSADETRELTISKKEYSLSKQLRKGIKNLTTNKIKEQRNQPLFNGVRKEAAGLYAYDLKMLASQGDLITYRLKAAIVGVNRHIDFCDNSQRISFLKDFDTIDMVPVPHRNTINFLGMKSKRNYIIWRESDGLLTALLENGQLQAWVIATGKVIKPIVTVGNLDFGGFDVYECNEVDDTYKQNWQQHPESTNALLKSKTKIDQYETEVVSILAENQAAHFHDYRTAQMQPNVFMFKVITMTDLIVREEFSFTFDIRNNSCGEGDQKDQLFQRLIFSRDLTKMMEIYSDSRCSIYTKRPHENKKRVTWTLTHQIKKYPTPLQASSYANFLFSPNFNFFIDVAVSRKTFVVRSSATNQIILEIPKGLMCFKMTDVKSQSMQVLASRMFFESENQIRVINKYGLDTVLQLNMDPQGNVPDPLNTVLIRSIVKIDHFNTEESDEKHAILDRKYLEPELTLERLVRTNQKVKVKMVHLRDALEQREQKKKILDKKIKKDTSQDSEIQMKRPSNDGFDDELDKWEGDIDEIYGRIMHQTLQTVDYSESNPNSQFVSEMSFTILDWQIIEKIVNQGNSNDFNVDCIDRQRLVQLCFNIFPNIKTVLHMFVEKGVDVSQLKKLMDLTNKCTIPGDGQRVTIPVLNDINQKTALDLALGECYSINLASYLLVGIQDYPFMHSGPVLVSGIITAFEKEVPGLGEFLDKRMVQSQHLNTKGLRRVAIIKKKKFICTPVSPDGVTEAPCPYGVSVANVWQDKEKLKAELFDKHQFKKSVVIQYFDIPQLHEFKNHGFRFFEMLQKLDDDQLDMFGRKSVQIIITQKWEKIKDVIIYAQCYPQVFLLLTNLFWSIQVRPLRSTYPVENYICVFVILFLVGYFVIIEVSQWKQSPAEYQEDLRNLINIFPLIALIQTCFYSMYRTEEKDHLMTGWSSTAYMFIDTFGILMMWLNTFFFLRIWEIPGYLARMIMEVIADMKIFFVVYCLFHMAFAHAFYFLSYASLRKHQFITDYWHAFRYSYLTALGEFSYTPMFHGEMYNAKLNITVKAEDNELKYIGWALLLGCCVLTSIVMLNLLIAIISGRFEGVKNRQTLYLYQEKASAIAQIQRILPPQIVRQNHVSIEEEILGSKRLLLIVTEKEETIADKMDNEIDKSELQLCKDKIRDVMDTVKTVKGEVEVIKQTRKDSTKQKNKKQKNYAQVTQPTLDMSKTMSYKRARVVPKFQKQTTLEDVNLSDEERKQAKKEKWQNPTMKKR